LIVVELLDAGVTRNLASEPEMSASKDARFEDFSVPY